MPKPTILIAYDACEPEQCDPERGICPVCAECPAKILKQMDRFEPPAAAPAEMCRGCGKCVELCPHGAIRMTRR